MNNEETMMVFQGFGILYTFFTFFRLIQYLMKKAGASEYGKYAWIFAIYAVMSIGASMGEAGFLVMMGNLFLITYATSIVVLFRGGMAAGSMLNKGFLKSVPAIFLIMTTISIGFLEPLISAPLCAVVLGLTIYIEYQETYRLIHFSYIDDKVTQFTLGWPPILLLVVLTDIFVLSNLIGNLGAATITTALTLIGVGSGYYRTKIPKRQKSPPSRPLPYTNPFSNTFTPDSKFTLSPLINYPCPECKKMISKPGDHALSCSQYPMKPWMGSFVCSECKKLIFNPGDHELSCSRNLMMPWLYRAVCPECKKLIFQPNDHALNCSKYRLI